MPDLPVGGLRAESGQQALDPERNAGRDRLLAHLRGRFHGRHCDRNPDQRLRSSQAAAVLLQPEAERQFGVLGALAEGVQRRLQPGGPEQHAQHESLREDRALTQKLIVQY